MLKGTFIVVEGIDGSGKSTISKIIKDWYDRKEIGSVHVGSTLDATPTGEYIRSLINKGEFSKLNLDTRTMLMSAATNEFGASVVKPNMEKGRAVIADRFCWSTKAYQHNSGIVDELVNFIDNKYKPDIVFYMNVTPETAINRIKNRGELDEFEDVEINKYKTRIAFYKGLVEKNDNVVVLDAEAPLDMIKARVEKVLHEITFE